MDSGEKTSERIFHRVGDHISAHAMSHEGSFQILQRVLVRQFLIDLPDDFHQVRDAKSGCPVSIPKVDNNPQQNKGYGNQGKKYPRR